MLKTKILLIMRNLDHSNNKNKMKNLIFKKNSKIIQLKMYHQIIEENQYKMNN